MKLNWADTTDYTGTPAPVEGKSKPRATEFSAAIGSQLLTVSRAQSTFPNEWAWTAAPMCQAYMPLQLPAWAPEEQAQERAAFRMREVLQSWLMQLPR